MCNYFGNVNFDELFRDKPFDDKISTLHNVLNDAIHLFVPTYIKRGPNKTPWHNKQLQSLKNKKNKEWKRFKITDVKWPYDIALKSYDTLNKKLYNEYVDKMKSNLRDDPSSFWQYVNSKKNTNNQPKIMRFRDTSTSSEREQANLFANFFGSNFTASTANDTLQRQSNNTLCLQLDPTIVMTEMTRINVKKGVGPDGIHPRLLKECASVLAEPLTKVFNESLATGIFPNQWKRSSVSPVFKKGARSNIENYRCIAKLPTIAKLFERLVNVNLLELVRDRITPKQHGFMKGRSTSSNLSELTYYIQSGLNIGAQVDLKGYDFVKAFDQVDHNILIGKLIAYNLPQNLLAWLKSYLTHRSQFVKLGASESEDFGVTSGVPQGSHLGPTLFLLFINDLVDQMPPVVNVSMYADDVLISNIIKTEADCVILQQATDKLKEL